tara:strand:- start:1317 stop:1517 length:201 start_codon:yes stop_codon:yes gene_type:complete
MATSTFYNQVPKLVGRREFLEEEVKIMKERYIPFTENKIDLDYRLNYVKICEMEIEDIDKRIGGRA